MSYYRERPGSGKLPSKEELIASICDGSFMANVKPATMKQKIEEWLEYQHQRAIDKYLFMGPPTYAEYCRTNHIITGGERGQGWDDRYDSLGRFHPEWHD